MSDINLAIDLLSAIVSIPSLSKEEKNVADFLESWFKKNDVDINRSGNNLWAVSKNFDDSKPTILLNSHIDTVKPAPDYKRNPYQPFVGDRRVFGLGSNDAGASVVCLILTFLDHYKLNHNFNLILALTAEEENGGENGIRKLLAEFKEKNIKIDMAIVGEPTGLHPAVGERGLVVLDCYAKGEAGHAARNEGVNALYIALDDIQKLRRYTFRKMSPMLGDIKINVTQLEAGCQHNVIPAEAHFVVDIRTTDAYSNEETVKIIDKLLKSRVEARSTRIHPSSIPLSHPLVHTAILLGRIPFVSPTTSDISQLVGIPSLKIGPGESARSHTADEYVEIQELEDGLTFYNNFLFKLNEFIK